MEAMDLTELTQEWALLRQSVDSLVKELKGNGQPGFIQETRQNLINFETWKAAHEAEDRQQRRWLTALWALVVGIAGAGATYAATVWGLKK